jgi:cytosine/adenosine deaminase-related metal-dependent hydrolase
MSLLLRSGRVLDGDRFRRLDVAIEGERIVAVGPDLPATQPTWDLADDLVIPGLVNAHYHSPDNLVTGRLPIAPLELWSLSSVPSRTSAPEELRTAALLGAAQLLRGGVTGVVDMVRPSPKLTVEALDAVADAYLTAGLRAAVVPVVRDLAVEDTLPLGNGVAGGRLDADADEQLGVVREVAGAWHGRAGRLQVQVGPSAPQRCSDRLFHDALDLARELGMLLHTHVLESPAQAVQARRRWGTTLLRHLDDLGALSDGAVLAHVVWPDPDEIDLLAARGAVVVHNPASNCALGSGRAPLPDLLAAGVRLALGTDAATCNDGLSMFEAMKLATIVHRPAEPDWRRWPAPGAALEMATRGGAAALGLADRLGRVAPGYLADLVVLDARSPAFVPPNDLPRQLVMRAGAEAVRHVIVGGQPVLRDRQLLTLDWGDLAAAATRISARSAAPSAPEAALVGAVEALLHEVRRR